MAPRITFKRSFTVIICMSIFTFLHVGVSYWQIVHQQIDVYEGIYSDKQFKLFNESSMKQITIAAIGDILLHRELQIYAFNHEANYKSLWQNVIPQLQNADITYANYEGPSANVYRENSASKCTIMNHTNKSYGTVYRSWVAGETENIFNYHESLADDVKSSGIDVVSIANNHILDVCDIGLKRTMEVLQNANMTFIGAKQNRAEPWYKITIIKQLNIAWVSCTSYVNKNGRKYKKENLLYCKAEAFQTTIERLHNMSSIDGIIVTIHAGKEYTYVPNKVLKQYVFVAIEAGASLVLCTGPHVALPIETFYIHNRTNVVVWSLGNFVSRQGYGRRSKDVRRRSSGILYFNMKATRFGLELHCFHYVPTCVLCKEIKGNTYNDTDLEFIVVNALINKTKCKYEREWMENVWGTKPTQCRFIAPTKMLQSDVSYKEFETKRKNKIKGWLHKHIPNAIEHNGHCARDGSF